MTKDSDNSRALIAAATRGDLAEVERLIPISNCTFQGSLAIRMASKHQHNDIVKLLTPLSDTRKYDSLVFRRAAAQGNVEMLRFLLPHSDPQARNSEALVLAIQGNHKDAFDFLLPLSDITQNPDDFIGTAANHGNVTILKTLLEYVRPHSSKVLELPAMNGHTECVEMLLPYCNVAYNEFTAWRWAIHNWRVEVVRLLSNHLDVNMFDHLALAKACENNDTDMIAFLFNRCNRATVWDELFHTHIDLTHEQRAPVQDLLAQEQSDRLNKEVAVHGKAARKKM